MHFFTHFFGYITSNIHSFGLIESLCGSKRLNPLSIFLFGLFFLFSLFQAVSPAYAITITTPTVISSLNATYDNQPLVVDGAVLTIDGTHSFSSLTLQNGAVVTQSAAIDIYSVPLDLTVADTLTIDQYSRIDVSGKGFLQTVVGSMNYSGGSHGGSGGVKNATSFTNTVHGDFRSPVDFGVGGVNQWNLPVTRGGGAVKISTGTLILDGDIFANGEGGYVGAANRAGGSGGSVWIDASVTVSGTGSIRANGGSGENNFAGGGGGGRVAIYYNDASSFDLANIYSIGGAGRGGTPSGGAGTIYLLDRLANIELVRVDNGVNPAGTSQETVYDVYGVSRLEVKSAAISLPASTQIGSIHIGGASLATMRNVRADRLDITGNSMVTSPSAVGANATTLDITAGHLWVDVGSSIDVTGKGLSNVGDANTFNLDNPKFPSMPGSGSWGNTFGGGVIKVSADQIVLDGHIKSDGKSSGSNGGNGGSVLLIVGTLQGSGSISASGGSQRNSKGGRVALYYTDVSSFDLVDGIVAYGTQDEAYVYDSVPGTVYLKQRGNVTDELRIKNKIKTSYYWGVKRQYNIPKASRLVIENTQARLTGGPVFSSEVHVSNADILSVEGFFSDSMNVLNNSIVTLNPPKVGTYSNFEVVNLIVDASSKINGIVQGVAPAGAYISNIQTAEPVPVPSVYGEALTLANDGYSQITFTKGFSFPFYGKTWNSAYVNENGNLTFGSPDSGIIYQSAGFPRISPVMMDFDLTLGGGVAYHQFSDRLIITWDGVRRLGAPVTNRWNTYTFQATLFSDGRVKFGYQRFPYALDAVPPVQVGLTPGGLLPIVKPIDYISYLTAYPIVTLANEAIEAPVSLSSSFSGLAWRYLTFDPYAAGGYTVNRFTNWQAKTGPNFINGDFEKAGITKLNAFSWPNLYENIPFTSGFSFPFYGTSYSDVYANADGTLSFEVGRLDGFPNDNDPAMIMALMLEEGYRANGGMYYKQLPDRFVVYWDGLDDNNSGSGPFTFQATLFNDGVVQLNFDEMNWGYDETYIGVSPGGWAPVEDVDFTIDTPLSTALTKTVPAITKAIRQYSRETNYLNQDYRGKSLTFKPNGRGGFDVGLFPPSQKPTSIVDVSPIGILKTSVQELVVEFDRPMQPLNATDVQLTGPQGLVDIYSLTQLSATSFLIKPSVAIAIDGDYILSVGPAGLTLDGTGMDQNKNGVTGENPGDIFISNFTLDFIAPATPVVASHTAATTHTTDLQTVVVSGGRENGTSILINGVEMVPIGNGPWSISISLPVGSSDVIIQAQDQAGHLSPAVTLAFVSDPAPVISRMEPAAGTTTNIQFSSLVLYVDVGLGGLDIPASRLQVIRDTTPVSGHWNLLGNQLLFTPSALRFDEGDYAVVAQVKDARGRTSNTFIADFVIDRTPPPALYVDPVPLVTQTPQLAVTGTKDVGTSVWVDSFSTGLVGHWKGDGDATDSSPLNLDSYASAGVQYTQGKDLQAFDLSGNQNIQVSDASALKSNTVTVSAWVNARSFTNQDDLVCLGGNVDARLIGTWNSYCLGLSNGHPLFYTVNGSGVVYNNIVYNNNAINSLPLKTNTWHHMAVSFDGQNKRAYLDGVLVATWSTSSYQWWTRQTTIRPLVFDVGVTPLLIGDRWINGVPSGTSFDGLIDDVRVYDRTLTDPEVQGLADQASRILAVPFSYDPVWTHTQGLGSGSNQFSFVAIDAAGNVSTPVSVTTVYDNTAPDPVSLLTVDANGDGTQISLDWSAYNDTNGDVVEYRVFRSLTPFTLASQATHIGTTVDKAYRATNLARGVQYYFAVVAVDVHQNYLDAVSNLAAVAVDVVPPSEVNRVTVTPTDTYAQISWSASASADAAYTKIYFNGAPGIQLPAGATSYLATGLTAASSYPFRITVVDNTANESAGRWNNAVTLLSNPTGVAATPGDGGASLSWQAVASPNLVNYYAVYLSQTAITDVYAMSPYRTIGRNQTTAQVAGLTNNTTYHFAVTVVNLSGGETKQILPTSTASATPVTDTFGPTVSSITVDGAALLNNATLTQPALLSVSASDPAGISRVEYKVDGQIVHLDGSGSTPSTYLWNIYNIADGAHTLTMTVFDRLDNPTVNTFNVNVALAVPAAPVITAPQSISVNRTSIVVTGTAHANTEVRLYNGVVQVGGPVAVSAQGTFSTTAILADGANVLAVTARNRGGESAKSVAVTVTVDRAIPKAPSGLTAASRSAGIVHLSWNSSTDANVSGYHVYRSASPFLSIANATKVNTNLLTGTIFDDLPVSDGVYYYSVAAVKVLSAASSTLSDLSSQVSGASDRTPPSANITYTPGGEYDPASGRMGPGSIAVTLSLSEALQTKPFLSITPNLGVPIPVVLVRVTDTEYSGSFNITSSTPTGTAYVGFSGLDRNSNRGTEVLTGATIKIDAAGPIVRNLTVTPSAPIENSQTTPANVKVKFELSEPDLNITPRLSYQLSPETAVPGALASTPVAINNLYEIGSNQWLGSFTLPADSGYSAVEILSFVYDGTDDLLNTSSIVEGENAFEVYQGNLPPLKNGVPKNFKVVSQAGGKAALSWNAVNGAAQYAIYRGLTATSLVEIAPRVIGVAEWVDTPATDDTYFYAVASVRQHNGLEAISAQSTVQSVTTDSASPAAPETLALQLTGSGILASWQPPLNNTEALTYRFYRSVAGENVAGLTPIQTDIRILKALDRTPSATEHAYVVTAVDAVGNQSLPSNLVYLNPALLPVGQLKVEQRDLESPVISWTHSNAVGYDIYSGLAATGIRLNQGLLSNQFFTDVGYSNNERTYTVFAIDQQSETSLGHTIYLPKISATVAVGSSVKRGIMNELVYQVSNQSTSAVEKVRLEASVGGHAHLTPRFNLAIGETKTVSVIVGGFADLPSLTSLETVVDVSPLTGEQARIIRTSQIEVFDGALALDVQSEKMTRGATGRVRFSMRNTSDVYTEIVTAQKGKASPEIRFKLLDVVGNVASVAPFTQALDGVRQIFDGRSVASIAPGAVFTSNWIDMPIPSTALDNMILRLEVDAFHYHTGNVEEAVIPGMNTSQQVVLVDTAYRCSVASVAPSTTFGAPVVISGQAIERTSLAPLAAVPLKLVLNVKGFEKIFDLLTDATGNFSYTYTPQPGENGVYNLSCIHPDVLERPDHGKFTIQRIAVAPKKITLNVSKNYIQTIPITVRTTDATTATNLRVVYDAYAQPSGVLPQGVKVTLPANITIQPNSTATINVQISADNSVAPNPLIVLKVYSDETGINPFETISIDANFSEAKPVLWFTPSVVETGVTLDSQTVEKVTLENRGLADMKNVVLSLRNFDGTPAPAWVNLTTANSLGTLAVGGKSVVSVMLAPDAAVRQAVHPFFLHVESSNHRPVDIGVYVTATTSQIGNVDFYLSDLFTQTLDANGKLIPGLAGATVTVQNQKVTAVKVIKTTGVTGRVLFDSLPAGQYRFRATALSHQDMAGAFWVKPNLTTSQEVFLDYNLVTVNWAVNQVTITDQYQINLNVVYETDVQAAVVVIEPASITLPQMQPGDVFTGEFRMTNHGLVRADNLNFSLPVEDNYRYELLKGGIPTSLGAKEFIDIAYRITKISDSGKSTNGTASGGAATKEPCTKYKGVRIKAGFEYTCTNGAKTNATVDFIIAIPPGAGGLTCKEIATTYQDIINISDPYAEINSSASLTTSAPSPAISSAPIPLSGGGDCSKKPNESCDAGNGPGS